MYKYFTLKEYGLSPMKLINMPISRLRNNDKKRVIIMSGDEKNL